MQEMGCREIPPYFQMRNYEADNKRMLFETLEPTHRGTV